MSPKQGKESKPRKNSISENEAVRRLAERGFIPLESFPGNSEMSWRVSCISCNREKLVKMRTWRKLGCRYCAKKTPIEEISFFLATGTLILDGKYADTRSVPVKCSICRESFRVDLLAQKSRGKSTCRLCSRSVLSQNEIERRLEDSDFLALSGLPKGATDKFEAYCKVCGKTSEKTINAISAGKGCKYCAPNSDVRAEDALDLWKQRGLTPLVPFPGANKPWPSTCDDCGEEVAPYYVSLTANPERSCRYCSGKAVNAQLAEQLMKDAGFTPLSPYPGSLAQWLSKCGTCGNTTSPSYSTVRMGGRCVFCYPGGVDYKQPAILYLITHSELNALKVGIQTYNSNRILTHVRKGWEVNELWGVETGKIAREIEQDSKVRLRKEFLALSTVDAEIMSAGGHTETFLTAEVSTQTAQVVIGEACNQRNETIITITAEEFSSNKHLAKLENAWT